MENVMIFLDGKIGFGGTFMSFYNLLPYLQENYHFDFVQSVSRKDKPEENELLLDLRSRGYTISTVYRDTYLDQYRSLKYYFGLKRYIAVHINFSLTKNAMLASLAAKKCGIPNRILHSHTNGGIRNPIKRLLVKAIARNAIRHYGNRFLACSYEAGEAKFGKSFFASQGVVLNNSIDVKKYKYSDEMRFQIREKCHISESAFVLGTVGRISKEKNQSLLLSVLKVMLDRGLDAYLLLVGDGKEKDALLALAKQMDIERQCIFTGHQVNVQDWLNAMDVFVLPSLYEGFGIAALEAQANGLPVICSSGVSPKINVTGRVRFVNLHSDIYEWVHEIDTYSKMGRLSTCELIEKQGYAAEANARILSELYQGANNSKKDGKL